MDELYDLETDPYELDNLYTQEKASKVLEDMTAELNRLNKEI